MALCTKENVKSYLDLPASDTDKDAEIERLIPLAKSFLEEYCNREFEAEAVTEYHYGGSRKIAVKKYPIDTTKTLQVWDDWQRVYGSDTLIDSDDYYVDAEMGIIEFDYPVGGFPGSVKVSYTGGDTPGLIIQASIELVAIKIKEGVQGNLGVPNRSIPEAGGVSFVVEDILPQTKKALDLMRKPPQ
jgi:hypothetical protein